jgi:hypothetical protein
MKERPIFQDFIEQSKFIMFAQNNLLLMDVVSPVLKGAAVLTDASCGRRLPDIPMIAKNTSTVIARKTTSLISERHMQL